METEQGREAAETVIDTGRLIRRLVLVMIALYLAILVLDYQLNYRNWDGHSAIRRLFNITREDAVGSFVAVTQTIFVAVTLWLIYLAERGGALGRWRRRGWLVLALFFTYMAIDDGNKVHERLGSAIKEMHLSGSAPEDAPGLLGRLFGLFPSYAWQVVFLPFFGLMGLFVLYFLWNEVRDTRSRVVVATAIACFVVAVGLDFIEGLEPEHRFNLYTWVTDRVDLDDFTRSRFRESPFDSMRHFSKGVEEVIEMSGVTLLWTVFLRRLAETASPVRLRFLSRTMR